MKRAFTAPLSEPSGCSRPFASMCTVKFSPCESPENMSSSPLTPPLSLIGSPCGQLSVPLTVLFFCSSTSFIGNCSTIKVQLPASDFCFASTALAATATRAITSAPNVILFMLGSSVLLPSAALHDVVLEHVFERHAKDVGNLKRDLERRRVLPELEGVDGLPRDADFVGELLLRHLLVLEAQPANVVVQRSEERRVGKEC